MGKISLITACIFLVLVGVSCVGDRGVILVNHSDEDLVIRHIDTIIPFEGREDLNSFKVISPGDTFYYDLQYRVFRVNFLYELYGGYLIKIGPDTLVLDSNNRKEFPIEVQYKKYYIELRLPELPKYDIPAR